MNRRQKKKNIKRTIRNFNRLMVLMEKLSIGQPIISARFDRVRGNNS